MRRIYRVLIAVCAAITLSFTFNNANAADSYCYVFKIYHFKSSSQEKRLDQYLQNAYLPALHRAGIKNVGVFKPVEPDTADKLIYVFIPGRTQQVIEKAEQQVTADKQYTDAATDYLTADYQQPAYNRIEKIILSAFPKMTEPMVPSLTSPKAERVYELRSYEGPTETYFKSKVKMFNDGGETVIFKRLDFNAVFYAEVKYGSHMPNLMYMTTFNNMEDRDKHWKAFSSDPEWKALSALPEYQHNVSKSTHYFVRPTEYSDY
jgi:hypothetical protein